MILTVYTITFAVNTYFVIMALGNAVTRGEKEMHGIVIG